MFPRKRAVSAVVDEVVVMYGACSLKKVVADETPARVSETLQVRRSLFLDVSFLERV